MPDELTTSFLHNSLLSLFTIQQSGDSGEISCGLSKKKRALKQATVLTGRDFYVVIV